VKLTKVHVDIFSGWQNVNSTKCYVDKLTKYHFNKNCWCFIRLMNVMLTKMSCWQNACWYFTWLVNTMLTKCHVDKMSCWQNIMLTKCHVDKMSCWQNVMLTKCHVDKMSCWQNVMLQPGPLSCCNPAGKFSTLCGYSKRWVKAIKLIFAAGKNLIKIWNVSSVTGKLKKMAKVWKNVGQNRC
jgi:hypothetical protein